MKVLKVYLLLSLLWSCRIIPPDTEIKDEICKFPLLEDIQLRRVQGIPGLEDVFLKYDTIIHVKRYKTDFWGDSLYADRYQIKLSFSKKYISRNQKGPQRLFDKHCSDFEDAILEFDVILNISDSLKHKIYLWHLEKALYEVAKFQPYTQPSYVLKQSNILQTQNCFIHGKNALYFDSEILKRKTIFNLYLWMGYKNKDEWNSNFAIQYIGMSHKNHPSIGFLLNGKIQRFEEKNMLSIEKAIKALEIMKK